MLSLTKVPHDDIVEYLTLNKQPVPRNHNDAYKAALNLIHSGQELEAPLFITAWVIASNLSSKGIKLPTYNASDILLTPDDDLQGLATSLSLDYVDKELILDILVNLDRVNYNMGDFDKLPVDALNDIISRLDCKSILLICKLSPSFSKFCQLNLVRLLRQNFNKTTNFNTDNFDRQQLITLCNITSRGNNNTNISAGSDQSLVLKKNGRVFSFGNNSAGQLGLGNNTVTSKPTLIKAVNNIIQVSANFDYSVLLSKDGQVYSCGFNDYGKLGLGDDEGAVVNIPTPINELDNIIQISAGGGHMLALTNNGEVFVCGGNLYGQLGLGDNNHIYTPVLVPDLKNIVQVSGGNIHTMVLSSDGKVYVCGSNFNGELGLKWVNKNKKMTEIETIDNIIQISAGFSHSMVLANDGKVYVFGSNFHGQLGLGDYSNRATPQPINKFSNVISIAAGFQYSIILTKEGKVYAFGDNERGQLGIKDLVNVNIPKHIEILDNIKQISAGYNHSIVLKQDGKVYTFGYNEYGQLGFTRKREKYGPNYIMSIS